MTVEDDREPFSVAHAIGYALTKIAYCDRMVAQYPDADHLSELRVRADHLSELRVRANTFLGILERSPRDLPRLRDLLEDLRSGQASRGHRVVHAHEVRSKVLRTAREEWLMKTSPKWARRQAALGCRSRPFSAALGHELRSPAVAPALEAELR
jgi:hypothetical protein